MQRLSNLDLQFSKSSKAAPKRPQPKGNFVDCWSYLNMDQYLTSEGIAHCRKVENFMTKINPTMYYYTENAVFPHHLVKEFADLGIVGLDTPKKYGGQGLPTLDACACMYELARKDASIATFYVLHHSLGLYTIEKILQDGPLKKQIFDECIPVKKVLAWGLTEPLNGSDASGLQTTAVKVPGGYKLTGQKRWVGNATFSDYICIWARNQDEGNKIQCFLTRQGQPGLVTSKIQRKMALRAVQNADIKLDDVFVPDHERMELAKDFASGTKEVLAHSRIFVAWIATGIAAGATEAAMKYCQERIQFKKPVAQFQLIQAKLVRCVSITSSLIALCTQITRMYEQMKGSSEPLTIGRIAMMKAEATAQCREVCKLARECMGGNGINLENQAMKALCDIEAIHSYEGSWEVNTLVAGREMTGLAAFK